MASSREKSLATIQEAQTAVSEVLGRIRFNTATFRGWNKVQATGRHLSQYKCRKNDLTWHEVLLTLGRTRKFIPPPWYKGGRGPGVDGTQPRIFDMLQYFETILPSVKAFHFLNKMRYILWAMAMLEAYNVTNNGRHLGFYQELEIRLKPRETLRFQ